MAHAVSCRTYDSQGVCNFMADEILSFEPATGAKIWNGKVGDAAAEASVARANWPQWAAQPLATRADIIRLFAQRVKQDSEKVADLIARESGKPLWEARTEVESVIAKIDISIKAYADRTSQRLVEGAHHARNALRHKPHGVMAVITPFNMPFQIAASHIVPALLAGNAVVFKPSEKSPAVGEMLVRALHESGVPNGVLRIVQGGPEQGKALASLPNIDGVLFTGSARTGLMINRYLVERPDKMLVLEMGANNPIVVWDTPDIHSAAIVVVQSAFTTSGQRCTAASRLIVRDTLYDRFMSEIKMLAGRLIVGDPHANPAPFMGPVIDNDTAEALLESFVILMTGGGKVIRHMTRPVEGRPFLTPGIIDVTAIKDRPDIELFGPLLQVVQVSNFDEAIREANASRYGMSASLIGGTAAQYDQFWANVRAGVVNWNRATIGASFAAPFGGVGLSGNHRPTAYYAADYCAFPVSSAETDSLRASIGVGLRPDATEDDPSALVMAMAK